jgi:hypothetical protein
MMEGIYNNDALRIPVTRVFSGVVKSVFEIAHGGSEQAAANECRACPVTLSESLAPPVANSERPRF